MKGFFIDAMRRTITPWTYEYSDMGKKLGGSMTLGKIYPDGDALYLSDDGMLRKADRAFRLKSEPDRQPFFSDGIVTGRDNNDPNAILGTLPPRRGVAELAAEIIWLTVEEGLDWVRRRHAEPAVTFYSGDGTQKVLATWGDLLRNLEGQAGGYHPDLP
jgi:hypothetical protein